MIPELARLCRLRAARVIMVTPPFRFAVLLKYARFFQHERWFACCICVISGVFFCGFRWRRGRCNVSPIRWRCLPNWAATRTTRKYTCVPTTPRAITVARTFPARWRCTRATSTCSRRSSLTAMKKARRSWNAAASSPLPKRRLKASRGITTAKRRPLPLKKRNTICAANSRRRWVRRKTPVLTAATTATISKALPGRPAPACIPPGTSRRTP